MKIRTKATTTPHRRIISNLISIFGILFLASTIIFIFLEFRVLTTVPEPPELSPTDLRTINIKQIDDLIEKNNQRKVPTKPLTTNNPFFNDNFTAPE